MRTFGDFPGRWKAGDRCRLRGNDEPVGTVASDYDPNNPGTYDVKLDDGRFYFVMVESILPEVPSDL